MTAKESPRPCLSEVVVTDLLMDVARFVELVETRGRERVQSSRTWTQLLVDILHQRTHASVSATGAITV